MKKLLSIFTLASLLALPAMSFANKTYTTKDTNVCGGHIVVNEDCANRSHRFWHVSCCEEGYRIQGISYTDHTNSDAVDTLSPICRSVSKGNKAVENRDFGREEQTKLNCHKSEILSGLTWKDRIKTNGKPSDSMDSISPICMNPATGATRVLANSDADNGGKSYKDSVNLSYEVVGIATRERLGDTTDCAALVVAPRKSSSN